MNQTGPSRYQVRVISPRLEPPNPALTFEMAEVDVSMRLGDKELDWAPLGEVRIDRVDSDTFSIPLRSTEWVVRPFDVAGFIFGTRERLEGVGEVKPRSGPRREFSALRPLAWAVLHGLLALSILGIGVVVGRYSLDGSNVLSGVVALLVMGVGLLWSRIVPGRLPAESNRKVPAVRAVSRPSSGVRLSGDVDILKDILGDRVQAGGPVERTAARPPIVEDAPWLRDVELPTLDQGADDLTVIRGIGPAVSSRLASAGVVTYKQIAHLTEKEFEKLGRVLAPVMHRIDLDAWHRDARMAYEHKYGQKLESAHAQIQTDVPSDSGTSPDDDVIDRDSGDVDSPHDEVAPSPEPELSSRSETQPPAPEPPITDDEPEPTRAEETPTGEHMWTREPAEGIEEAEQPGVEEPGPAKADSGDETREEAAVPEVTDPDELGFILTDLEQIESAWKEIDDSVLMLDDPDEPDVAPTWDATGNRAPENGHEDDLTVIKGIGQATARKLTDIGIVSLRQIAEADAEQIRHMEAALGFRQGRFSSEGWQELARKAIEAGGE